MDPLEGLVLHTVGYDDGRRHRPILHRASISEMVVPYGDPGPMHGWKNAFDVGEWGLGRMANSLKLGCDCLGEITYLDAVFASEHGQPLRPGACHLHPRGGLRDPLEAPRHDHRAAPRSAGPGAWSCRSIATVGQLRVRLLLVLLPRRHHPARGQAHRHHVHPGGSPRRGARLRDPGGAAVWPRRSTSICSAPASTSRSTGQQLGATRSTPDRTRPGRRTRGATPSAPRPPCSRPRAPHSARSTRRQPRLAVREPPSRERARSARRPTG